MKCIFCATDTADSKTIEHIIPESLGNIDAFVLERGIVCDKCNNHFGRKIEQPLLEIPFFKQNRHRKNIKSKNGKIPPDKAFAIDIDSGVIISKDKTGENFSFDSQEAMDKMTGLEELEICIPIFGFFDSANIHVSKFLAKAGVEALAFWAHNNNVDINNHLNQPSLDAVKKFARNAKQGEFWPYHTRFMFKPDTRFFNKYWNESTEIVMTMRFIRPDDFQLFHQVLLFGTEFTIDLLQPTTARFINWLSANSQRSPVMEGAIEGAFKTM